MSQHRYVCWEADSRDQVLTVEVVQSDEVFLATHTPVTLKRMGSGVELSEEEFLDEFLKPDRPHTHAVIVGPNGCGKSHLVKWMSLHIPPNESRKVVLVPRVGANLRQIVERILDGMEGEQFEAYRARLAMSASSSNLKLDRERLLDAFAQGTGQNSEVTKNRMAMATAVSEREEIEELSDKVPLLLRSEAFRAALLKDGGVLEKLTDHVLGKGAPERRSEPLTLTEDDLPLKSSDVDVHRLNKSEAAIYLQLQQNKEFRADVLKWLNGSRDYAIGQLLNLGGDQLNELLLDVRRSLRDRDMELVLLIEDFAKTQGYDAALEEAILVRPGGAVGDVCPMRTVLAVTPGYMPLDTIQQRVDLMVDMNVAPPAGAQPAITFTSKYLNAIRWGAEAVEEWAKKAEPGEVLPSKCSGCEFRHACHEAFGEHDGVGFYPFNVQALETCYERVKEQKASTRGLESFNPRTMVNGVLATVLKSHREEVQRGNYPSKRLLEEFGRGRMPAARQQDLQRRATPTEADRLRALFELYGDPERLGGVPDYVFEAFGLPKVSQSKAAAVQTAPAPVVTQPREPDPGQTSVLERQLAELDAWSNREPLSESLRRHLQEVLHKCIVEAIDWDDEMLDPTFFRRIFPKESLSFPPPETRVTREVLIEIPLQESARARTATALSGLLLFQAHRSWDFPDAAQMYAALCDLVDEASRRVVRELRSLNDSRVEFDPAVAAAGLLAIGARLAGAELDKDRPATLMRAILRPGSAVFQGQTFRAPSYENLLKNLERHWDPAVGILRAHASLSKGGASGSAMLDAGRLVPAIQSALGSVEQLPELPEGLPQELEPLRAMRRALAEKVESAVNDEFQRQAKQLAQIRRLVPVGELGAVVATIERVIRQAAGQGRWRGGTDILALLPQLADPAIGEALTHLEERLDAATMAEKLEAVCNDRLAKQVHDLQALLGLLESDGDKSLTWVDQHLERQGGAGAGVSQTVEEIDQLLNELNGFFAAEPEVEPVA